MGASDKKAAPGGPFLAPANMVVSNEPRLADGRIVYDPRGTVTAEPRELAPRLETLDGVPVSLDGKKLPNAPEHSLKIGIAHTWNVAGGATLTARWDAYWQSDSYAREFNTIGDEIDSWTQHNASAIYERENWTIVAWVRNVMDDDNVTGKYLTSDTSGFFRNYFVTEPRIFGVSARLAFGD